MGHLDDPRALSKTSLTLEEQSSDWGMLFDAVRYKARGSKIKSLRLGTFHEAGQIGFYVTPTGYAYTKDSPKNVGRAWIISGPFNQASGKAPVTLRQYKSAPLRSSPAMTNDEIELMRLVDNFTSQRADQETKKQRVAKDDITHFILAEIVDRLKDAAPAPAPLPIKESLIYRTQDELMKQIETTLLCFMSPKDRVNWHKQASRSPHPGP